MFEGFWICSNEFLHFFEDINYVFVREMCEKRTRKNVDINLKMKRQKKSVQVRQLGEILANIRKRKAFFLCTDYQWPITTTWTTAQNWTKAIRDRWRQIEKILTIIRRRRRASCNYADYPQFQPLLSDRPRDGYNIGLRRRSVKTW